MEFNKWLEVFMEEKKLDNKTYEIKYNEFTHYIDLDIVIELIKGSSKEEKNKIKDTIVKLDFYNGDLHHFFRYLAEAYIKINY